MAKRIFKKGDAKPENSGRKKGTPNKRTAEANAILERAMLELSGTLEEDVKAVNSSRRLQLLTDLFNYVKPKLSATTNKNENDINGDISITIKFDDGGGN